LRMPSCRMAQILRAEQVEQRGALSSLLSAAVGICSIWLLGGKLECRVWVFHLDKQNIAIKNRYR
jgi:hypothetical protein